mmetsp:Transcript_6327/g.22537  ORF Transcript_6327/g.22537 Transcript_6327/m.22537 type:complete len:326 (+) Transcript_6327:3467-4444(+)
MISVHHAASRSKHRARSPSAFVVAAVDEACQREAVHIEQQALNAVEQRKWRRNAVCTLARVCKHELRALHTEHQVAAAIGVGDVVRLRRLAGDVPGGVRRRRKEQLAIEHARRAHPVDQHFPASAILPHEGVLEPSVGQAQRRLGDDRVRRQERERAPPMWRVGDADRFADFLAPPRVERQDDRAVRLDGARSRSARRAAASTQASTAAHIPSLPRPTTTCARRSQRSSPSSGGQRESGECVAELLLRVDDAAYVCLAQHVGLKEDTASGRGTLCRAALRALLPTPVRPRRRRLPCRDRRVADERRPTRRGQRHLPRAGHHVNQC